MKGSAVIDKNTTKVWKDLKQHVETATCKSQFYHWLISSGASPRALAIKLVDPWPGDSDMGRAICRGHIVAGGIDIRFYNDLWSEIPDQSYAALQLHDFSWLRDLRALGGDVPRRVARYLVEEWLNAHDRWNAQTWHAPLLAARLTNWLSHHDFFAATADTEFHDRVMASVVKQARHLSRILPQQKGGVDLLQAAQGLVYAGLSLPNREAWVVQGFEIILRELPQQILSDGGHVSRAPESVVAALKIMIELRCALNRANLPVPEILQQGLDRAGQALRFFRYPDKKLGLFNGGTLGDVALMDFLQTQIPSSPRTLRHLPQTGFERVTIGRGHMMVDTGGVPSDQAAAQTLHSSPLAFEFSYGKERIFTNCGAYPFHPEWQQVLRHTAAHNALTLNGTSVEQVRMNGALNCARGKIKVARQETRESCLMELSHDGFLRTHNVTYRRRLFLCDHGHDLRGEETLTSDTQPLTPSDIAIRFHLHPRVVVSPIQGRDDEVLLQAPNGLAFRFFVVGAKLTLENSVYFGSGDEAGKTRQLVIESVFDTTKSQIKWALQRA